MSIFEDRTGSFMESHPGYGNCAVNIKRPRMECSMITAFWGDENEKIAFESILSDFVSECWQDGSKTDVLFCPDKSEIDVAEETAQLDFENNGALLLNAIISFKNSNFEKILGDIFDVARDFSAKKNYRVYLNLFCLLESDATDKRENLEIISKKTEANGTMRVLPFLFSVRNKNDFFRAYNAISRLVVLSNTGRENAVGKKNFMLDFSYSSGYTTNGVKFYTAGFCDASVDIKSLYLTGFDEFSDSVIKKLRGGDGKIAPETTFCFDEAMKEIERVVSDYTRRALNNSRYLLKNAYYGEIGGITVEEYNRKFCNGLLERYYDINAISTINSLERYVGSLEVKIEKEMTDYIIEYGLDNAIKCIDKLKEMIFSYPLETIVDYGQQTDVEEEMLNRAFSLYERKMKQHFSKMILAVYRRKLNDRNANKIYNVNNIVEMISQSTEAKKQELADIRSIASQKVVEDVKRAAEQIVPLDREKILFKLFNDSSYDNCLQQVFDYYDKFIVDCLIDETICYADNYNRDIPEQVRKYCEYLDSDATLSAPVAVGMDDKSFLYYAAIVDSCDFNSHLLDALKKRENKEPMVAAVGGEKRRFILVKIKGVDDIENLNGLN